MNDADRMARMERQQEVIIQGISGLADTVEITNAMVAKLMEWMDQPPSNDLADTLKALAAQVGEMRTEIAGLPEKVARAVQDGEV